MPNKRIGQITVWGGGGANCSKQIIVQCEKATSIFAFFSAEAIYFTQRDAKASLEKYTDRRVFFVFLPNIHKLCSYSRHRRYSNRILYICEKPGNFPF